MFTTSMVQRKALRVNGVISSSAKTTPNAAHRCKKPQHSIWVVVFLDVSASNPRSCLDATVSKQARRFGRNSGKDKPLQRASINRARTTRHIEWAATVQGPMRREIIEKDIDEHFGRRSSASSPISQPEKEEHDFFVLSLSEKRKRIW